MPDGILGAYADGDRSTALSETLADLQERLQETEEDGADIAICTQETERTLRIEISWLEKKTIPNRPQKRGKLKGKCAVLAFFMARLIALLCFH